MLPAEIAQSVRRLQFVTGRQVADVMAGAYLSVFKGRGMEFDEVRPYVPGDDVRSIDWNVTARTGEPHVKRYVEDQGLPFNILIDESRDVLRAYGVWHMLGLDAWNIARPALFLIDRGGAIRYSFVSNRQDEFPSHDEIVREIDRL